MSSRVEKGGPLFKPVAKPRRAPTRSNAVSGTATRSQSLAPSVVVASSLNEDQDLAQGEDVQVESQADPPAIVRPPASSANAVSISIPTRPPPSRGISIAPPPRPPAPIQREDAHLPFQRQPQTHSRAISPIVATARVSVPIEPPPPIGVRRPNSVVSNTVTAPTTPSRGVSVPAAPVLPVHVEVQQPVVAAVPAPVSPPPVISVPTITVTDVVTEEQPPAVPAEDPTPDEHSAPTQPAPAPAPKAPRRPAKRAAPAAVDRPAKRRKSGAANAAQSSSHAIDDTAEIEPVGGQVEVPSAEQPAASEATAADGGPRRSARAAAKKAQLSIAHAAAERAVDDAPATPGSLFSEDEVHRELVGDGEVEVSAEKRGRKGKGRAADKAPKPKPKKTKRKKPSFLDADSDGNIPGEEDELVDDVGAGQTDAEAPAKKKPRKPKSPRKRRDPVEDIDSMSLDPGIPLDASTTRMADIINDPGVGHVSNRFVEAYKAKKKLNEQRKAERDRKRDEIRAKVEARMQGLQVEEGDAESSTTSRRAAAPDLTVAVRSSMPPVEEQAFVESHIAPQLRVGADGEWIVDEQSMEIDRAADPSLQRTEEYEEVEERDADKFTNSLSWSRKERGSKWAENEVQSLCNAVSMFGYDFEMISRMMPGRSRTMVKNKWKSIEKKEPTRAKEAWDSRIPLDLSLYGRFIGIDLSGPAAPIKVPEPPAPAPTDDAVQQELVPEENRVEDASGEPVEEVYDLQVEDVRESASPPSLAEVFSSLGTEIAAS